MYGNIACITKQVDSYVIIFELYYDSGRLTFSLQKISIQDAFVINSCKTSFQSNVLHILRQQYFWMVKRANKTPP